MKIDKQFYYDSVAIVVLRESTIAKIKVTITGIAIVLLLVFGGYSQITTAQQQPPKSSEMLDSIKEQLITHGGHIEYYEAGNGSTKLRRRSSHKFDLVSVDSCILTFTEIEYSISSFGSQKPDSVLRIDKVKIDIADIDPSNIRVSQVDSSKSKTLGENKALYSSITLTTLNNKSSIQIERTIIRAGQHDVLHITSNVRELTFDKPSLAIHLAKPLAAASQACKGVKEPF
jgi:hypothetical protein